MSKIAQRSQRLVNLDEFQDTGAPLDLGFLDIQCPYEDQYVLRCAIRAEGGEFHLPENLQWTFHMFQRAFYQQTLMGLDHDFCYITVRHGLVRSETDDAWHLDGFSTKVAHVPEQNYIWTSSDPTEYVALQTQIPQDFDPLRHNINNYLAPLVDDSQVQQCVPGVLYCLDPYILHRRPQVVPGTMRTFVRVSFVPIEINDIHNSQNPLLPRIYSADGVAHRNTLTNYSA